MCCVAASACRKGLRKPTEPAQNTRDSRTITADRSRGRNRKPGRTRRAPGRAGLHTSASPRPALTERSGRRWDGKTLLAAPRGSGGSSRLPKSGPGPAELAPALHPSPDAPADPAKGQRRPGASPGALRGLTGGSPGVSGQGRPGNPRLPAGDRPRALPRRARPFTRGRVGSGAGPRLPQRALQSGAGPGRAGP